MHAPSAYQILAAPVSATLEEKRSEFIALLLPVKNRGDAVDALAKIHTDYPGANHYCWAYILGNAHQPQSQAFSDDGEPAGTAGKPILNVLTHRHAGDTLAVVVRFFGGIRLGAGGLVRAYSGAVSQAVDLATWQQVVPTRTLRITTGFAHEDRVRHCLSQQGYNVTDSEYASDVVLTVNAPLTGIALLSDMLQRITAGDARITTADDPSD